MPGGKCAPGEARTAGVGVALIAPELRGVVAVLPRWLAGRVAIPGTGEESNVGADEGSTAAPQAEQKRLVSETSVEHCAQRTVEHCGAQQRRAASRELRCFGAGSG